MLLPLAMLVTTVGLAACGGGTANDVVATVGNKTVTKSEVNQWMSTLASGDYTDLSGGHTLPEGLVSEPADYARCVSSLEAAIVGTKPSAAQLLTKCRQIYLAVRMQATTYLVKGLWVVSFNHEEGIDASQQEVMQLFKHVKAEQFPTEADLHAYLTSRRLSMAEEMFILKLDLLYGKETQKITAGGEQVQAKFIAAEKRWAAMTSCKPGYVVEHCKQYTGTPAASTPSAAILMEQVAAIVGA